MGRQTTLDSKSDFRSFPIEIKPDAVSEAIADAKEVLIIPGYGMAVARAQSQVATLATICKDKQVNCRFGIHPVAGRMPGQMNVLLAEAGVHLMFSKGILGC